MTDSKQMEMFIQASKILNDLRNSKWRKTVTGEYLDAALGKLHAACGSELIAGLDPDAAKKGGA